MISIESFLRPDGATATIAHRGFSGRYPENTLIAFEQAACLKVAGSGVDMVELDVTLSKDGAVVVIHDETVNRTSSGSGRVRDLTLAELRELDAGSWFSDQIEFPSQRIPTLEEVLNVLESTDLLLNVEIKGEVVHDPPEELPRGYLVDTIATLLRRNHFEERVIVSSFEPRALLSMRERAPSVRTASLYNPRLHRDLDPKQIVDSVGSKALNIKHTRVDTALLTRCHELGIPLYAYTVDQESTMRRLIEMGIDGLFTNRPDRMLEVLSFSEPP